ncbi:capsular polysaccharide synthesis protein [Bifidobacterium choloepi]|uniref:Polysaccharide biosynthesis protein n=1 Tax=Bifidobacterium choloepi TaxID=2614131 RepID=A0A6I5N166_9BIFI|nr:capsular polysaccharide synthesis protein [Bifidobacterium choloepi]NEG70347.1 hypothetical protein [Bifidobacterium choloepi]
MIKKLFSMFKKMSLRIRKSFSYFLEAKKILTTKTAFFGLMYHICGLLRKKYYQSLYQVIPKKTPELCEVDCTQFCNAFYETETKNNGPIWTMWWQGADDSNTPPLIRACIESIQSHANGRKVNVITQDNFSQFVTIPPEIVKKVQQGEIGLTEFSDLIRCELLYQQGGIWIDSTCYLTKDLPTNISDYPFFSIPVGRKDPIRNWTSYYLASAKGNPLFYAMSKYLSSYYGKGYKLYDYFVTDITLSIIYQNNKSVREMIDNAPLNNKNVYALIHRLDEPINDQKNIFLSDNTYLYKLTYKLNFKTISSDGTPTLYSQIINSRLNKRSYTERKDHAKAQSNE